MKMEQILREELELSELMNRVMATPLKPHLEKTNAIEEKIKNIETNFEQNKKSLTGVQGSIDENYNELRKVKNSLEEQFEELTSRMDELEKAILKKNQEQQGALLTAINNGYTQLLNNSNLVMGKIEDCNNSLSKSLIQLENLETNTNNIELSNQKTLISINSGHDLLREQTEPIKNIAFLIEKQLDENLKTRKVEYLEQQQNNIEMSEAICELPKKIDSLNQKITLTTTTQIDTVHANLIGIFKENTTQQQQQFLNKLKPIKILLALNFTIMLCVLGLFILQTIKII